MTEDRIVKYFDGELPTEKRASLMKDGNVKIGIYTDVETTGLEPNVCEMTEIGIIKFMYDADTYHPLGIIEQHDLLNEPSTPLTENIIKITGLTDKILKGHKFDVTAIEAIFADADIVLAHNAGFDRAFTTRLFRSLDKKVWGCSKEDVPWKEKGQTCQHLQHLCNNVGEFWYDGHRALIDCAAAYKLLNCTDSEGITYMAWLLSRAFTPEFLIDATGFPFSTKDELKAAGFFWNPDRKVWSKVVTEELVEYTSSILKEIDERKPTVSKIDPVNRFRR